MSGFHGKGEDFLAAVDSMSSGKVGVCMQAKIDLAVQSDGKNTRNLYKGNILELVSEEKHPHLLLSLKGASKLINSSLLSTSHSSHARQVSVTAPVLLQCTTKHWLPSSSWDCFELKMIGKILASVKMLYIGNDAK